MLTVSIMAVYRILFSLAFTRSKSASRATVSGYLSVSLTKNGCSGYNAPGFPNPVSQKHHRRCTGTVYCTLELAQNPRLKLKTGLQQLMMKE